MILAAAISLGLSGPARAQEVAAGEAPAEEQVPPDFVYDAVFEEAMYVEKDIMLHGLTGYGSVSFSTPRGWDLSGDPELVLRFAHSAELLPEQSSLTVLVNDVSVATVALGAENASGAELVAAVPRELLGEYNTVTFAGVHKRTESCQDPYDMSLWTRIGKDSALRFPVRQTPVRGELLEYPYPLFDELGFGPMALTWVSGEGGRSAQSLSAAGQLALGLGRLADYRGVALAPPVRRVEEAETAALMVGTVAELPEVSELVDTSSIQGDQGLVAILPNPADPKRPVLVVTSHSERGLLDAVGALNSNTRLQTLSGPVATTSGGALDDRLPASRQQPLPMAGAEATLSELGLEDATVRGYYAPQFRVPIVLEGGAAIRPEGGVAHINYAYSAGLDTRLSTIEVRLNGVTLRSAPLDEGAGDQDASLRVRLPPEVVEPHSYLDVVFHLFPEGYDACEWRPDETHWATLYASSEIAIPRDHYAMMPDLSRLRYRGWPFNLEAGPVALVLADEARPTEVSAMLQLAAQIGAWGSTERPDLQVVVASDAEAAAAQHRVLLVGDTPHPYFNRLVKQGLLSAPGEVGGRAVRGRKSSHDYIEQAQDGDDTVMVLRSTRRGGLLSLVDALGDSRVLAKLDHNLALLTEGGAVQTYETAQPQRVGEIPPSTQARLLLQRHWASWGLFAVFGAMVFAGMVRGWAARRGGEV